MPDLIGKPSIHPFLFYTGKIGGYLCDLWIVAALFGLTGTPLKGWILVISVILVLAGIYFIFRGILDLGASVRMGLPREDTKLMTGGIFRYTRNPIYVGLHLMTLAAIISAQNIWIVAAGLYSFIIYHLIILAEERFLQERFGDDYKAYLDNTKRYLW